MSTKSERYAIDLRGVTSPLQLHTRVGEGLSLPEWYGGNFDALYDLLTEMGTAERSVDIAFLYDGPTEEMMEYFLSLKEVCRDAQENDPFLKISFVPVDTDLDED